MYKAKHKIEEKHYVIKKLKIDDMSTKDQEFSRQETRLLQKLRHPNIVAFKDSF